MRDGCKCQGCGCRYKVDLNVPDDVWERIKPFGKPKGSGLMCGSCIMMAIEKLGQFDAYSLEQKS